MRRTSGSAAAASAPLFPGRAGAGRPAGPIRGRAGGILGHGGGRVEAAAGTIAATRRALGGCAPWPGPREAANAWPVTGGHPDPSLAAHLSRITAYSSGTGLLDPRLDRRDLRRALAAFITTRAPALLARWIAALGRGLALPQRDWPSVKADQEAALMRWARHVGDPENLETYLFLRSHTRRGFIAQFPASRFLASQMRFVQLLAEDLQREYANDPQRARALTALLEQEFALRILHITDFFVEAREDMLRDQEASYRRAIDHAPAC